MVLPIAGPSYEFDFFLEPLVGRARQSEAPRLAIALQYEPFQSFEAAGLEAVGNGSQPSDQDLNRLK